MAWHSGVQEVETWVRPETRICSLWHRLGTRRLELRQQRRQVTPHEDDGKAESSQRLTRISAQG